MEQKLFVLFVVDCHIVFFLVFVLDKMTDKMNKHGPNSELKCCLLNLPLHLVPMCPGYRRKGNAGPVPSGRRFARHLPGWFIHDKLTGRITLFAASVRQELP